MDSQALTGPRTFASDAVGDADMHDLETYGTVHARAEQYALQQETMQSNIRDTAHALMLFCVNRLNAATERGDEDEAAA